MVKLYPVKSLLYVFINAWKIYLLVTFIKKLPVTSHAISRNEKNSETKYVQTILRALYSSLA